MTDAPFHDRRSEHRPLCSKAFTLIELLVVIGIIAVLAGVLIPVVLGAIKRANSAKLGTELAAIGIALEAYKADFGDYPRPDASFPGTGGQVLAKALMGIAPAADITVFSNPSQPGTFLTVAGAGSPQYFMSIKLAKSAPPPTTPPNPPESLEWEEIPIPYADGGTGPGFRIRASGRVYGPYLSADKFKVGKQMLLLDSQGNPILYFPARGGPRPSFEPASTPVVVRVQADIPRSAKVTSSNQRLGYVGVTDGSFYNVTHNRWVFDQAKAGRPLFPARPWLLHAADASYPDVRILRRSDYPPKAPETPVAFTAEGDLRNYVQVRLERGGDYSGPYLLWSPGVNGTYFDDDDVTNIPR